MREVVIFQLTKSVQGPKRHFIHLSFYWMRVGPYLQSQFFCINDCQTLYVFNNVCTSERIHVLNTCLHDNIFGFV